MTTAAEFAAKITAGDANLDRLESAVNDAPGTWTTSEGVTVPNLRKRLEDVGYLPPVTFASGLEPQDASFTVTYQGATYHADPDDTPFTTTGTFNAAQWVLLTPDPADFVSTSGDTVTGEIIFYGGIGPVLARLNPLLGDTLGYVRARVTDGVNQRTRNLIRAVATADADILGDNYPWKGVLSYMPPNQGGGTDGVEWDELGLRSRAFGGQFEYHLITPYGWGADPAASGAANDPWFGVMEQYLGGRAVDLMGLVWPVTHIPDLPGAVNGFWSVTSGGVTVLYPAAQTLRTAKGVLAAPLAYCSWAQNNGDAGLGREKFVAFTVAENHGSAYKHQSVIGHSDGDHWSLDYMWGPTDLASSLGWYITGLGVDAVDGSAGAVLHAAVRAQNTSSGSDDQYHLFVQTLGTWVDANNVLSTTSGLTRVQINRSALNVRACENDEIEISGVSGSVGGIPASSINGRRVVNGVFDTVIEFQADSAATSTVTNLGGNISVRIRKQPAKEVTFVGGKSLGEALRDYSGGDALAGEPVMVHGLEMLKGANSGEALLTWSGDSAGGSAVGIAKIRRTLRGNNEADVEYVREITGVDVDTTEPSLVLVEGGAYDGYCIVTFRTQTTGDEWELAVSSDEFASNKTNTVGQAGFVTKSPLPICQIGDYIFGTCTGTRGDNVAQGSDGHALVDVYLMVATIEDLVTTGASAMKFIKVAEAQEWNHASGIGTSEVSPVGVGTITPMGDHVCIYYSQSRRLHDPAQPMGETIELKVDVSRWVGGAPSVDLSPTESPQAYLSIAEYTNSGAAATGDTFAPSTKRLDTMPGAYDPTTGVFTPRASGTYRVTVRTFMTSDGTAQHMRLHREDNDAEYDDPYSPSGNQFIVWQNLPVGSDQITEGSEVYYLEAGVGVYVRVSDGDVISSTIRNMIRWERVD